MSKYICSLLLFWVFFSGANSHSFELPQTTKWQMSDFSILLPLPNSVYDSALLKPQTQGAYGPLISAEIQALLPQLFPAYQQSDLLNFLRVVGVRIDPCFAQFQPTNLESCRTQIRLVWQPLFPSNLNTMTLDAAVHSFYELSHSEFQNLLSKLSQLKQLEILPTDPSLLQVNTTLSIQGYKGQYWSAMSRILLESLGSAKMSKITFMSTIATDAMWDFGGFDFYPTKISRLSVPKIGTSQQSFINKNDLGKDFRGGIRPFPNDQTEFNQLTSQSVLNSSQNPAFFQSAINTADQIENPAFRSPENTDCASCHAAGAARNWILTTATGLERPFQFRSFLNLTNPYAEVSANTLNLRAFGYFRGYPVISQRVINESASIVELVNRR